MLLLSDRAVNIGYDDVGHSGDVLVLLHGQLFKRSMWLPQIAGLSDAGWRILVPDLRGHGSSSVVSGAVTLEQSAGDVAAFLDLLGVGRVVLGGTSLGAYVALEFCRRHPSRVRGILLASARSRAESLERRQSLAALADRLDTEGLGDYAAELLPRMLSNSSIDSIPRLATFVLEMVRRGSPVAAAATLRGLAQRDDYDETLRRLSCPAMVVVGSEDELTSRHEGERMRQLLPDCELAMIRRSGHLPNLEAPRLFNDLLRRLLTRVRRTTASIESVRPDGTMRGEAGH